jgi:hypothetical protein
MKLSVFSYHSCLLASAVLALVLAAACKESYAPPLVSTNNSYLVVEGFINNGPDTTRINLSHTFKLDDSANVVPELQAVVTVEGKSGDSYALTESGGGLYIAPGLTLNAASTYRLHIRTSGGKEYASDYVELKTSPPIDSISYKDSDLGLQIYANTHDPQGTSRYYRWEYSETWEFTSVFYSLFKYQASDTSLVARTPNNIYTCWQSYTSSNIIIGSSAKLAQDVIYQFPLVSIAPNSWKISVEYSILLKQYVLTQDAYNFWQQLQKNSEQIGSIFSPQPSEAKGNIHNLADSTELVIGYISAGTMRQQRIYILPSQLPGWRLEYYTDACEEFSIPDDKDSLAYYLGSGYTAPIDFAPSPTGPRRYWISPIICIDCTLTGTNVKPYFWP